MFESAKPERSSVCADARGAAPSGPPRSPPRGLRPLALPLAALLGLTGCLTPQMGRKVDETLGLSPPGLFEPRATRARTAFDSDAALPARIWYSDDAAKIYHERRTNTFIAYDPVHKGWGAIPRAEAFERGFKPERSHLLASGPPEDVKNVIDYLTEMEPTWRGS